MTNPEMYLAATQMAASKRSKNLLTNVEFIALKMQSHPGQSGRFYRAALSLYKDPVFYTKHSKSAAQDNGQYFLKPTRCFSTGYRYPGNLWVDSAKSTVEKSVQWGRMSGQRDLRPARSIWHLTKKGWAKANAARTKLGLEPIPFPG